MMRVALVALALAIGTIVILALSDALSPSGIGSLSGGPGVLLLCIPISLALFALLAHRKKGGSSLEKKEKDSERIPGR